MRFVLQSLCVIVMIAGSLSAQADESEGPVYQRHRAGAGYGGQAAYGFYPGYPPFGLGYYQQPISGDWFTRPYPSHFDYFRLRNRAPATPLVSPDCPCAEQQSR